jgi:hypothetical protein
MKRTLLACAAAAVLLPLALGLDPSGRLYARRVVDTDTALSAAQGQAVQVAVHEAEGRVDVTIDGRPFTSYLYPATLQKPVLYPIRSAGGAIVTRGYPLEPRPGERADHPHHVGHWFNYGDVNGYDFWGHSDETPPQNKPKMGTIVHRGIVRSQGGSGRGSLTVRADWTIPDGSTLLHEETQFIFAGSAGRRTIDRITTWTADKQPVTFNDTKEGAFGIRVARPLEHPTKERAVFIGADGKKEGGPLVNTEGATGRYIASDGTTGEAVWGTRGPWMGLTGTIDGSPITLAILDHPSNHGHPTYWHARGYGLFAANPFGRHGYDPKQDPATFTLAPGKSVTFRHQILIADAHLTKEQLQRTFDAFAK